MISLRRSIFFAAPKIKLNAKFIWLILSLTFAIFYGVLGLKIAFSSDYVVQDDARQHIFWMRRFLDPQLFPNDLLADYFQSVAPLGYTTLYQIFAMIGIDPMLLNKFLPILLCTITTGFCFSICLQMFPVPFAGFLATLLLNQYLWLRDDLVSGTAVAFVYPLFTAFIYYLLRHNLFLVCLAIALLGMFYPQGVFICAGILVLQLVYWQFGCITFTSNRRDYLFCAIGLGVAFLALSVYALKSSDYGPVITATEARTLPEFQTTGLSQFFVNIPQHFWFTGQRSGIMPKYGTILPILATLFLFPMLLFSQVFPLVKQLNSKGWLLVQITIASLLMFFVAHALLFTLHLPTRYTEHSLRIVTAIAGGIAIAILLDALFYWVINTKLNSQKCQWYALGTATLLFTLITISPFVEKFPKTDYVIGKFPPLYEFFAQQPKDILIASLTEEVANIPSFSQRSILVGGVGFPIPYHKGYYAQIRQRMNDLIAAQYSPDLQQVQSFIQKYHIDYWLVENSAWDTAYISGSRWIRQYNAAHQAVNLLQQGKIPALAKEINQCLVFQTGDFVVLQATCIMRNKKSF
ncbi:hypothetical protein IQ230_11180 [Gloeocapsopsis crepidinum LEGE 06123]|uniref:Glycosyltransferase RgtA/B/C/D-like domain-containing protein n=1 Tax=Gloeocapsopsis crepidinum LEGE 06123 TaxID=588587 RepID=A0ABR9URM2_9CHRO|nr:hypothetical protein [Gloeocapsopsis crepidinum]MBE9190904.1 hypothetical protein [Gloeocapsopsis crepidinum LEGE 06123]